MTRAISSSWVRDVEEEAQIPGEDAVARHGRLSIGEVDVEELAVNVQVPPEGATQSLSVLNIRPLAA